MRLTLLSAPSVEPLSADEVRARLTLGSDVADETIESFITAARQSIDGADGWLGRCLINQTWRMTLPGFPCRAIELPLLPLQDTPTISYLDPSGASQDLSTSQYRVIEGQRPVLLPASGMSWPTTACDPEAVAIEFTAGYGSEGADVPEPIRQAIVLMVSQMRSLMARNILLSQDIVEGVGSQSFTDIAGRLGALDGAAAALLSTFRVFR